MSLDPSPRGLRAVPFRQVNRLARRKALRCRAQDDRSSAVTDIRKIDVEKGGLTHTLRETVFTPETLVPIALGIGGAFVAGYGQDGAVLGKSTLLWCFSCAVIHLHVSLI